MTTDRRDNSRHIRARRGSEIKAKHWTTEAAVRMLMNNLDDEVAEDPQSLVVYGGIGRAARNWAAYDKIVETLERLEEDQTLLIQSGKPVGVFRTHKDAPRVLLANSNLVPKWATWEKFNELDRLGLMMYGQMTAGSWIYIGSQGIVQGTYETFAEMGRQHFGGDLKGKWILTAGLGGMGGAQPLAAVMAGAHCIAVEVQESSDREAPRDPLCRPSRDQHRRGAGDHRRRHRADLASACSATPPKSCPKWSARGIRPDAVTDQTSAHDPANGYCPAGWSVAQWTEMRERDPAAVAAAARKSMAAHVEAMLAFQKMGIPTFDYGNNIRQEAFDEGVTNAFDFPGFVPAYVRPLFCRGVGPFRWAALSGDPEDIRKTDAKVKELIPDDPHLHRWLDMAARADRLPGPAGAHLLGRPRPAPPPRPRLQRDGAQRRAVGPGRHRPRPSRQRQRRLAQPRDRGDAGRQRRGQRLAACSTPCSTPPAARPGSRSTMAAASAWAIRSIAAW